MPLEHLFRAALWLAAAHTPGGAQEAPHPIDTPDAFAWHLFENINRPVADDPQGRVLWETWALASGVFADPDSPPSWQDLTRPGDRLRNLESLPLQQVIAARQRGVDLDLRFDPSGGEGNETRMNRSAFDFVVDNDLYHLDGQVAFFSRGESMQFPIPAKEVKAQWRRIDPARASRFHTASLTRDDGTVETWGLTSLHITTKDVPNWFWCTFEHADNPDRENTVPSRDDAGLPDVLRGTKWENYVLRGSQVDFVTSEGVPTILASSQIEQGFESTSSCITCHARASIGAGGSRLSVFAGREPTRGHLGAPDPSWFYEDPGPPTGVRKFVQTDFVWSLFRARRRTDSPVRSLVARTEPSQAVDALSRRLLGRIEAQTARGNRLRDYYRGLTSEAFATANTGALDDRQYVERFVHELRRADSVLRGTAAADTTIDTRLARSESIFRDPRYIDNARRLIQEAAAPEPLRIVGGVPTDDFPDCVAVGSLQAWCCTGTLIASNLVVTAGHCLDECSDRVYFGSNVAGTGSVHQVAAKHRHPMYGVDGKRNDLTCLVLAEDVVGIEPREIAASEIIDGAFSVRVVGFGTTDVWGMNGYGLKRMVDVPVASSGCEEALGDPDTFGCDDGLELVAGSPFLDRDSCRGDSGGPVYVLDDGVWYLAGATSRATANSVRVCGDGGIYVRLDAFADWIRSIPGVHW